MALLFSVLLIFSFSDFSQALCVDVKKANLRSGPSTKKPISWEVFRYMPLREIRRKGQWIEVKDFEGDTHWVFHKLVTKKFKCAVVKAKKVNLRTGPGTKFKKPEELPSVEQYTVFKFNKVQGKWAQVTDSFGDSYWVFRKLLWVH